MIKLILRFVFFFSIVFCTQSEIVGQTNNFQCTPFHIGVLASAPPCTSSGGYNYGNPITLSGNTINSTYFYIINYKDSTHKGWVELTR